MPEKHKRNPNIKCAVCDKPIYRRPCQIEKSIGRFFCSTVCHGIYSRKENPCLVCGTPILASLHKRTCGRGCSNKHRAGIKYGRNSPKSIVKSQQALKMRLLYIRGKICGRCNYDKYEILQVHHKDRNRKNNNLNNLELICPNCHYEEHFLEKSWLRNVIEK